MTRNSIETLLVIEDDLGDVQMLRGMLRVQGSRTEVTHVRNMHEAEEYLAGNTVDIILLDLGLPDAEGLEAVQRTHAKAPHIPLVVLTGLDDESLAAHALHEGAQDYLLKGEIDARGLVRALRYAVERKLLQQALLVERERAVTLNSLGDAVAATDLKGNISFLNVAGERVTGWSQQRALGRPIGDVVRIVDAVSREAIANPMQYARTTHWRSRRTGS